MELQQLKYFKAVADIGKISQAAESLLVWHLVGGKDLLYESERTGNEPDDGYPVSLEKWIERDGLKCLKIKLTGSDGAWDYDRVTAIGKIALKYGVEALSPDFNCLVKDPSYVNDILDKLKAEYPAIYDLLIYVEQPFPYDLEANQIDVHSCSQRKPLFMDESAHDWHFIRMGRELGWDSVALKSCKTLAGARIYWEIPDHPGAAGEFLQNAKLLDKFNLRRYANTMFLTGTIRVN